MSDGNRCRRACARAVAIVAGVAGGQGVVYSTSKLDELILRMPLAVQGVSARGGPRRLPQVRWRLPVIGHRHLSSRTWIGGNACGTGIAKATRAVCHIRAQPVSKIESTGTIEDFSVCDRCYAVIEIPIAILANQLDARQAGFRVHRNRD